jgi:hypothetical protein
VPLREIAPVTDSAGNRAAFDWDQLDLPRWTPLSHLGRDVRHLVRGLYAVSPCLFALCNEAFGSPADPGIGGFLWARSTEIAVMIYERQPGPPSDSSEPSCPPPPTSVLGFEPLTYGAALAHLTEQGDVPQLSATYTFPDGQFLTSEIRVLGREYVFATANPDDGDPVIAVRFNLAMAGPE